MVYTGEKTEKQAKKSNNIASFLDPVVLRSARQIYQTYCSVRANMSKRPVGVAIDRNSHRGQLIFHDKPILLPGECFVLLNQLESEIY